MIKMAVKSGVAGDFARNGYIVQPDTLGPDEIREVRQAIVALLERGVGVQTEASIGNAQVADKAAARKVESPHRAGGVLADLPYHQRILTTISLLAGSRDLYLHHSKVLFKPPGGGMAKTWHQDHAYWTQLPPTQIACWIAIDDATLQNGCLQVVPGSHRLDTVPHTGGPTGAALADAEVRRLSGAAEPVAVEVAAGTAVFFHCRLLHMSARNDSGRSRWAIIYEYDVLGEPTRAWLKSNPEADALDAGRIRQVIG